MTDHTFEPQHVIELVQAIFTEMLQLQCNAVSNCAVTEDGGDERRIGASVQIQGDWIGAVEIHTTEDFGRKVASRMMMITADEIVLDDIYDTIGELSNMVGGSLKGILPGKSSLSLPTVASGVRLGFKMRNSESAPPICFECDGQTFAINIKHYKDDSTQR